ncbi:MAG TPA: response regulator [Streptosporangiaceae bacterium]|nr:response regulator [Streptosporangiaceae bacterium]
MICVVYRFSTKPQGQGTGLGLATVYGIITRAGGYAQIYSEPGPGTTVTALLPATEMPVSAAEPRAAPAAGGHGETVLLVEDEQSLSELAVRILTRNGYRVYAAATPQDAHRYASDPAQLVDLLLTDVVMPDMLGNELAALVREARPGLPDLSCPATPGPSSTSRAPSNRALTSWRSRSPRPPCSPGSGTPSAAAVADAAHPPAHPPAHPAGRRPSAVSR